MHTNHFTCTVDAVLAILSAYTYICALYFVTDSELEHIHVHVQYAWKSIDPVLQCDNIET